MSAGKTCGSDARLALILELPLKDIRKVYDDDGIPRAMRVTGVLDVSYRIVVAHSIREIQSVRRRANALVTRRKKCKRHSSASFQIFH